MGMPVSIGVYPGTEGTVTIGFRRVVDSAIGDGGASVEPPAEGDPGVNILTGTCRFWKVT